MTNPVGALRGGIIAVMIDDCMGAFFVIGLANSYPTIKLYFIFFNLASESKTVLVWKQVVRKDYYQHESRCFE